jgi:hypothetical protein
MSATAQPKPRQTPRREIQPEARAEECLRVAPSPEESWKNRQRNIDEFNKLCEEATRQARANGLTEEILAEILAER